MKPMVKVSLILAALIASACSDDASFKSGDKKDLRSDNNTPPPSDDATVAVGPQSAEVTPQSPAPAPAPAPAADPDPTKSKTTTITNSKDTARVTETFAFPAIEHLQEDFANPANPLDVKSYTWAIPAQQTAAFTVLAAGAQTKTLTKTAPLRYTDTNAGIKFVLNLVVDSSESAVSATYKQRNKDIAARVVAGILQAPYDAADIKVIVCGLEDNGNIERRILNRGTSSLADFQATVSTAVEAVMAKTGTGVEKVLRTLSNCAPAAEKIAGAVQGYFALTDAANCLNNDGTVASTCSLANNTQTDNFAYLDDTNLGAGKNLAAFGFYYRMANGGICNDLEQLEANTTYAGGSQYQASIKKSLDVLYPTAGTAPAGVSAPTDLAGNYCAADTSGHFFDAADHFGAVIRHLRSHRVKITRTYDTFASDPGYNLALSINGNAIPVTIRDTTVAIADESQTITNPIVATYHQQNNYRVTAYPGLLSPKPDAGYPVTMEWTGGSATCVNAAALTGTVPCRFNNTDFEFRIDALPATDPVNVKSVAVTIRYKNEVEKRRSFDVVATDPILGDSLDAAGPSGALPILQTTYSADRKTVTVRLGDADLDPGAYMVRYRMNTLQTFSHGEVLADGANTLICFKPTASATLDSGNIKIDPANAVLACTSNADRSVSIRGDGTSTAQPFKVALKGQIAPIPNVALKKAPDPDTVIATIIPGSGNPVRSAADAKYTIDGQKVVFAKAIQPGESVMVKYDRHPPLPGPDFTLSSFAQDGTYTIKLGPADKEADLAADTDYTISLDAMAQTAAIKLLKNGTWGDRLEISYVQKNDSSSEQTTTEQ